MLTDKAKDTRPVNSSELRIGNILKDSNGNEYAISGHGIYTLTVLENTEQSLNDYMPVCLTKEHLVRFGFSIYEWMDGCFIPMNGKHLMIQFYNDETFVFLTKVTNDNHGQKMTGGRNYFLGKHKKLRFVHQLQNLYYTNSGKELTLKS